MIFNILKLNLLKAWDGKERNFYKSEEVWVTSWDLLYGRVSSLGQSVNSSYYLASQRQQNSVSSHDDAADLERDLKCKFYKFNDRACEPPSLADYKASLFLTHIAVCKSNTFFRRLFQHALIARAREKK